MAKAKIRIKNIYWMLSYAYQSLREVGFDNLATGEFDNIHDLFAAILVHGISAQVKQGLHRDYIERQAALAGLRGQMLVSETIKQQTIPQGRLVCSFDEFSPDTDHNQVLKSVMMLLLKHGDIKAENRKAIRRLLPHFADVSEVEPGSIRWASLKYHRNNASYRMLMGISWLTVKGLLMLSESGVHKLSTWLQDEAMHRLYEKFVLRYFLRHHPEYLPKAAYINWDVDNADHSPYLPAMKSDITLQNGQRTLIIDTKYYRRTMQRNPMYDYWTFNSSHLYQIYAYVKNWDKGGTGKVAGILLYAKTDEEITPDAEMVIGGNQISLKTLDLNQEWVGITSQLEHLCEWLGKVKTLKSEKE